jgi:DNA (cytosine-5)-methyltransferase 1
MVMVKTAISLFAGAGGCSLGFKQAGFDVLLAIEKDADAVHTYNNNFPEVKCLHEDITELDAKDVMYKVGIRPRELTFLIGGPPCQGFSSAGTRFLDDPRNKLVKHYLRFLKDIQPRWFLMENVEGLLTAGKGTYFPSLVKSFIEVGYSIQVHKLYSHWYGLPQKRKRVFLIGNLEGSDFTMPSVTHSEVATMFEGTSSLSVLHAINDLPNPVGDENELLDYDKAALNDYQQMMRGSIITDHWTLPLEEDAFERVRLLLQGQAMKHLPEHLQHPSFKRRAFRRVMDGTPTESRGGAPSGIKRLDSSEPCLTITSASPREFIHPTENRFLTLRECARIQSFPDNFEFCGSAQSKIKQVGNAIPPLIAKILAEHLIGQDREQELEMSQMGKLLDFSLTKAEAMSPVLQKVNEQLDLIKQETIGIRGEKRQTNYHAFATTAFPTQ